MAEIDEHRQNGITINNDSNNAEDSDDGDDTAFENPVMKFFRSFPNVSDNTIRKIQYVFVISMDGF